MTEAPKMLITGVGGMAGRHLAIAAVEAGYRVIGTYHSEVPPELVALEEKNKLVLIPFDLRQPAMLLFILYQPDIVVHLAGQTEGRNVSVPWANFSVFTTNTVMLHNVVQACLVQEKMPRFVLASSIGVYGQPSSALSINEESWFRLSKIDPKIYPYQASQLSKEEYLIGIAAQLNPFFEYIIARPAQHTGPGRKPGFVEHDVAKQIVKIINGGEPVINVRNKLAELNLLDVRDVALAYLALAQKGYPGEQYNIVSGAPTTVEQICNTMLEIAGIDPKKVEIRSTSLEKTTFARFSNNRLRDLGWEQKHSLIETLQSFWDWFVKSYSNTTT